MSRFANSYRRMTFMPSRKQRIYFDPNHEKTTIDPYPNRENIVRQFSSLSIDTEESTLLDLLPDELRETVLADSEPLFCLREIILDYNQRPYALFANTGDGTERKFLHEDPKFLVTKEIITNITEDLNIGGDNRAGIDGMLHRISVMRNRIDGEIYGLTLRVGRSFENNASMIEDVLLHEDFKKKSILVMGVPGSGKTSVIRSVAKTLSENGKNVVIVDTSNEIAGDGISIHKSLGLCRRLMVPKISEQSNVMIEGLQNHTPEVMIIDEISKKEEVKAAKTIKFRGVRLIASAHGTFEELVKNPDLNQLLGGFQNVILSASEASRRGTGKKTKTERAGAPVFDVIVELSANNHNEWKVITNVGEAIDAIMNNTSYTILKRTRNQDLDNPKIYEETERSSN